MAQTLRRIVAEGESESEDDMGELEVTGLGVSVESVDENESVDLRRSHVVSSDMGAR